MKRVRRFLAILLVAAFPAVASAQFSQIPQRNAIFQAEIETNGIPESFEVFDKPVDGVHDYYLSVGHLGIGDAVIQVNFDPLYELFIPLGNTLDEALETLKDLQDLYRTEPGTVTTVPGCLAFGFPDGNIEDVKVTYRKQIFSNLLEFTLEREGYQRSTFVNKSNFNSIVSGVKFYKKLHPKD